MINHAQKWGELNGFEIDADEEEDGTYTYFLDINELCFEITEDSVKHCANEYTQFFLSIVRMLEQFGLQDLFF